MNHKIRLGNCVKEERIRRNLTQQELAEKVGLSVRTIADLENYKANLQYDTLYPIIHYLALPVEYIFFPEHQPNALQRSIMRELSYFPETHLKFILDMLRKAKKILLLD